VAEVEEVKVGEVNVGEVNGNQSASRRSNLKRSQKSNRADTPRRKAAAFERRLAARGQILVMLTILIPVLLGVVAMGVDITVFYWTWAKMHAAADAAVLAGAASLPDSPTLAIAAARTYAQSDGMAAGEIATPVVAADKLSISVQLTRAVPYYFGQVLGLTSSPVVVNATASLFNTGKASGALPIGLSVQTTYAFGQAITLHQGGVGPGNWDGLALGGTGGANFSNNLANGYPGQISAGDSVTSEPGLKTGPTSQGINTRVSNGNSVDPGGTWSDHTLTDPRVAIVPVVDWTGCHGRCSVPVKGFGALWITGASGSDINAVFIGAIAQNAVPSQTAVSFGTYRALLTQ
jgi:Flp pilus assembly protein TadG